MAVDLNPTSRHAAAYAGLTPKQRASSAGVRGHTRLLKIGAAWVLNSAVLASDCGLTVQSLHLCIGPTPAAAWQGENGGNRRGHTETGASGRWRAEDGQSF